MNHQKPIRYSNPRNAKLVQVACPTCGFNAKILHKTECNPARDNIMVKNGWSPVSAKVIQL